MTERLKKSWKSSRKNAKLRKRRNKPSGIRQKKTYKGKTLKGKGRRRGGGGGEGWVDIV